MRRMLPVLFAAFPLTTTPVHAHAGQFVGANFGITHYSPDKGEGVTSAGWGEGMSIAGLWQPGLRLGGTIGSGQDELFADTALLFLLSNGSSVTTIQFAGNYQHDFSKPKTPGVYLNAGAGFMSLGGSGSTVTVPIFGGGLGYGNPFADGHGRFRLEVRYDHQGEDTNIGLSAADLVSLRLGFDVMN